jgi:hypothetical protein
VRLTILVVLLVALPLGVAVQRLSTSNGPHRPTNGPGWGPDSGSAPDPTGAISPRWYVQLVNRRMSVWTRKLAYAGPDFDLSKGAGRLATLATGDPNSPRQVFDPQMIWDRTTSRFYFAMADRGDLGDPNDNALAFGWSRTSDPRDPIKGWCHYELPTPARTWDDYPKLGDDANHIIVGSNRNRDPSKVFAKQAWLTVIGKPPSGTACPSRSGLAIKRFGPLRGADGSFAATPVPANTVDGSKRGYVVAADHLVGSPHEADQDSGGGAEGAFTRSPPKNRLTVWHVEGSRPNPRLELDGGVKVPDFFYPGPIRQPGTSARIDPLDARLTQAVANSDPAAGGAEAVWTVHTVGASRGGRAQVRWYELAPSRCRGGACPRGAMRQAGTIADSANSVFLGAVSPDLSGAGAAINFNVSGPRRLVAVRVRTRGRRTPLGQMRNERTVARSRHPYTARCEPLCRWGDYAGASADPTRPGMVWGTSELSGPPLSGGAPQWFTRIFPMELPGGAP